MLTKTLPLIGALVIAGAAWAQAPAPTTAAKVVGKVGLVEGLVTVSNGTSVGSVVANAPVLEGSRFVTGSTGMLDLAFNDGCVVKLAPNQSVTVVPNQKCDDRKGSVARLADGAPVVAGVALGGGGLSLSPITGLGFVAAVALIDSTGGNSPGPSSNGGGNPGGGGGIPNPPPSGQ
jgi:hypothetical protein